MRISDWSSDVCSSDLAANDATLATVALRPRLIWGPGDPHLLPGLVARARAGRLRLIDGGDNRIDTNYVDNAAQAHVDVFDHLWPGSGCCGKAYFISKDRQGVVEGKRVSGRLKHG